MDGAFQALRLGVVLLHKLSPPQTDGQTERVNALLECYLRHFVSANQHDWAKILDVAQFSYNLQRSEATGKSPFELATGQQPSHLTLWLYLSIVQGVPEQQKWQSRGRNNPT
ncbi:hypothetical protein BUALT_Bualt07G0016900 [Buddleja alternifolia]|uniref:Integrase catalytic domain-containing protein n=1 Tax=Buddleja alternifolia TaxID=168488 RepID=A0AAV6XI03_9LAMI|nr:hypothetical protein BUALT_Bualt07G0016900 [Buddleja alternifolia]